MLYRNVNCSMMQKRHRNSGFLTRDVDDIFEPSTFYPRPSTYYPRPSTLDKNLHSQIIGRIKFSIRFESLCWILRDSPQTRMSQNQAKSNYQDCSFGNRDSFVKGTRLSVLILAKSQAGRKFEVLEVASLVSIHMFLV